MAQAYFTSETDENSQWQSTMLNLPYDIKPYYTVLSGGQSSRFIYTTPERPIYWGCMSSDYYGVWVLHNPEPLDTSEMPIGRITSHDIECSKLVLGDFPDTQSPEFCGYWATYFAQALINSDKHFLNSGHWRIEQSLPYKPNTYVSPNQGLRFTCNDEITSDILQYIDWTFNAPFIVVYFQRHDEYDGRVKWWRKKVREGVCPPIFTWFKDNIQSHFVIDGHARLLACALEGVTPTVLTISSIRTETHEIPISERQKLQRIIDKNSNVLPTDVLNSMLLKRHADCYEYERTALYSTAVRDLDERWMNQILQLSQQYPIDATELQSMIDRH